jgi:hypothetical protein
MDLRVDLGMISPSLLCEPDSRRDQIKPVLSRDLASSAPTPWQNFSLLSCRVQPQKFSVSRPFVTFRSADSDGIGRF